MIADKDEAGLASAGRRLQVDHAAVADRQGNEKQEAQCDHPAARLQLVALGKDHESEQKGDQQRGQNGDGMQARVIQAQHVGPAVVAVYEIHGRDQDDHGKRQGSKDGMNRDAAVVADDVENEDRNRHVERQQRQHRLPVRGHFEGQTHGGSGKKKEGMAPMARV